MKEPGEFYVYTVLVDKDCRPVSTDPYGFACLYINRRDAKNALDAFPPDAGLRLRRVTLTGVTEEPNRG